MTQLLQEMIELHDDQSRKDHLNMLLEYLGNLSVIDKTLVKSLTKAADRSYGSTVKKAPKLSATVGQKSKVEKKVATGKNGDQLWKFFDDDKNIMAIVLDYDGKQVMAISDKSRTGSDPSDSSYSRSSSIGSNASTMYTVATDEFFSLIMPEVEFDETFASSLSKNIWRSAGDGKSRELKTGGTQAKTFIRKLLDLTVKKARTEKKEVNVMYIYRDEARTATKADRSKTRIGRVPTPIDNKTSGPGRRSEGLYTDYIKGLKSALMARLDKFKASKAKSFDTVEEMLKFVRDEGYLDKLKVNGHNYSMYDSRMYFNDLLKQAKTAKSDSWSNESYVEYRIEGSTWKLREKVSTEVQEANPDMDKKDLYDLIKKTITEKVPPDKLRVMYALKGGSIIPVEVKAIAEF